MKFDLGFLSTKVIPFFQMKLTFTNAFWWRHRLKLHFLYFPPTSIAIVSGYFSRSKGKGKGKKKQGR